MRSRCSPTMQQRSRGCVTRAPCSSRNFRLESSPSAISGFATARAIRGIPSVVRVALRQDPASATAAGLVGFAIGTETGGSIVSPASACGAVGLRPTYGRVSRYGCMTLRWTLDKVGPITRSIADAALVLSALARPGRPGRDGARSAVHMGWRARREGASHRLRRARDHRHRARRSRSIGRPSPSCSKPR